jgi:hypothetical protein
MEHVARGARLWQHSQSCAVGESSFEQARGGLQIPLHVAEMRLHLDRGRGERLEAI